MDRITIHRARGRSIVHTIDPQATETVVLDALRENGVSHIEVARSVQARADFPFSLCALLSEGARDNYQPAI